MLGVSTLAIRTRFLILILLSLVREFVSSGDKRSGVCKDFNVGHWTAMDIVEEP
jgi:hypothetical protein